MSLFSFLQRGFEAFSSGLGYLFPFSLQKAEFLTTDIRSTYSMILTDTFERTHGLNDKQSSTLPDSCVKSSAAKGLISHLATAMTDMSDLFLVYDPATDVVRRALPAEEEKIKKDYSKKATSTLGAYISFQDYSRTQRLRIYSELEFCILVALNKSMNLAKAIQLKVNELRATVSLADSAVATDQAKTIAHALGAGQDVLLDAKDMIETATPDISATEKAMAFLDNKKSFILSLPISYISGTQTGGIGSTGEADSRAVERGLKQYFESIVKPVCKELFGEEVEFRSQDFREMGVALEALKTLSLVDDTLIVREEKRQIIARMFQLDPNKKLPEVLEPKLVKPVGDNSNVDSVPSKQPA
jgi:hypothetical protein